MHSLRLYFAFAAMSVASPALSQILDANHMVFFDWGKPELTSDAKAALDRIVGEFATSGKRHIVVHSYSDRSGPATTNLRMSRARGDVAAAYLKSKGVAATAIKVDPQGERDPLIPTADGVREVQNRRIDIEFAD